MYCPGDDDTGLGAKKASGMLEQASKRHQDRSRDLSELGAVDEVDSCAL